MNMFEADENSDIIGSLIDGRNYAARYDLLCFAENSFSKCR